MSGPASPPAGGRERARARAAAAALACVALALRLGLRPWEAWFNPDEATYVEGATAVDPAAFGALWREHTHPPGYWWLCRALARVSAEPLVLRLPAFLGGLACLGALAVLGRRAGGRAGAALGALVGAVSTGLVLQSVVVRPYTLHVFATALWGGALLAWLRRGQGASLVALLVGSVAAVLLLYTSAVTLLASAALAAWTAVERARAHGPRAALGGLLRLGAALAPAAALAATLYLTHVRPQVLLGHHLADAQGGWGRAGFVAGPLEALAALGASLLHGVGPVLALPVSLLSLAALRRPRRALTRAPVRLALLLLVAALTLSAARLLPLGASRHALHLVPAWVLLAAEGLRPLRAWLRARGRGGRRGAARGRLLRAAGAAAALLGVGLLSGLLPRGLAGGVDEQVIPRAEVEEVERALRASGRAWWLTDVQTHHVWVTRLPARERVERPWAAGGGRTLEGAGLAFAYPWWVWRLPLEHAGPDDPLERALAWLEARGLVADGRVGLVTGGWDGGFAAQAARALRSRPGGATLVSLEAGGAGLSAAVVDLRALRDWRAGR